MIESSKSEQPDVFTSEELQGDGPLYLQIVGLLERRIEDGTFSPGDRFPSEPKLAASFQVSRLTLRQALALLQHRGLIDRVVGRRGGTFVRSRPISRDLTNFAGFSDQLRRQGRVVATRVLRAELLPASAAVAAALELDEGETVAEIRRLRLEGGAPVVLECSSFPGAAFPGLLDERLDQSLYQLLHSRYDRRPTHARETIEPLKADRQAGRLLGVQAGTALLAVERTAFDGEGTPVEFARDLFRGDRARMTVWSFEVPSH